MTRIGAFDLGAARIGVAVSDFDRTIAFPRTPIVRVKTDLDVIETLAVLCIQEELVAVIVGIPVSLNGDRAEAVDNIALFIELLRARLEKCGVVLVERDERFTTKLAAASLRDAGHNSRSARSKIDSASACMILQEYLDDSRIQSSTEEPTETQTQG